MCRCLTTSSSSVSPSRAPTRWSRRRGACCTSTDYGHPGLHGSALPHDGRGARGEVAQAGRGRREGRRHARRGGDGQGDHGPGGAGRVVKRDLEEAGRREKGEVRGAAAPPAVPPQAPLPSPISPALRGGAPYEDVPLTQIRKTIAKRLATSLGPIPHFFLTSEVDMERASEARDALNTQLGDQGKVSFNDIMIKATAHGLTHHPAGKRCVQEDHTR